MPAPTYKRFAGAEQGQARAAPALDNIKAGEYEIEDLLEAVYLNGIRDAMDYLKHLLEEGAEA